MRRILSCAVLATAAFAAGAPSAHAALPASAKITTMGLGPLKIRMTESEVERVLGRSITPRALHDDSCRTARIGHKTWLMFNRTRLMRISVDGRRYATRSGVRVGDSKQEVLDTYPGRLTSKPHAYDPGGVYLTIHDGRFKVVFTVSSNDRVTEITTGRAPYAFYVEGCA